MADHLVVPMVAHWAVYLAASWVALRAVLLVGVMACYWADRLAVCLVAS